MIELRLRLRAYPRQIQSLIEAFQSLARLARLERGCAEVWRDWNEAARKSIFSPKSAIPDAFATANCGMVKEIYTPCCVRSDLSV